MTHPENERTSSPLEEGMEKWRAIWSHVLDSQNQLILSSLESLNQKALSDSPLPLTVFDPQVIQSTLAEVCEKFFQNPEPIRALHTQHLTHLLDLVGQLMDHVQGKEVTPLFSPSPRDRRFKNPLWKEDPFFFFLHQLYCLNTTLLEKLYAQLDQDSSASIRRVKFYLKHIIDAMAPTNFPLTNPDVLKHTYETGGENLIRGFKNFLSDYTGEGLGISISPPNGFTVGEDLATTPGHVLYRNDLFELIYYTPLKKSVFSVPLLIIPPWINKFYIFDLRPENSFVRWALSQGFTVFMVSWVNPEARHGEYSLTDYMLKGVYEAVQKVQQYTQSPQINLLGYCTGGVLVTCLLSYLGALKKQEMIGSATLVATPTDFQEAGDLLVYICEKQLKTLESHVRQKGFLPGEIIIQAFNLLRANDLIWPFYIKNYLMGQSPLPFDMLHWNCDAVRLPAKMHLEFLRSMYLENQLISPKSLSLGGISIDLGCIQTPLFVMAAKDDHIAPWKSVFPLIQHTKGPRQFVLSGSGHVAGVFNPPFQNKYHFWRGNSIRSKRKVLQTPEDWLEKASKMPGSWWPFWQEWIQGFAGNLTTPFVPQTDLGAAPGHYVLGKS